MDFPLCLLALLAGLQMMHSKSLTLQTGAMLTYGQLRQLTGTGDKTITGSFAILAVLTFAPHGPGRLALYIAFLLSVCAVICMAFVARLQLARSKRREQAKVLEHHDATKWITWVRDIFLVLFVLCACAAIVAGAIGLLATR